MARYILEFLFCSGLFIALYKLLIEERVAHSWARVYLVAGMLLSAVIPMLELPIYPAQTLYYELPLLTFTEELPESTSAAMAEPKAPAIDWTRALSMVAWGVYLIVCGLNIARFVYRLWVIRRLRTIAKLTVYEAYTLAESERVNEPFSFWRTIFMNYMFSGREREQILIHERSHVLHRHTAERLTLELLRCVFWFNPFVWLAANALVEVQEWEADSDVLNQGYDVYEYRQLIFRQLFGYNADITCGLNSQLTKKRFLMMTNFKRGKLSFIRLGVAIPMVVAMILAFGAVRAEADDSMEPIAPTPVGQNLPDEEKSEVYISADGKITFNDEVVTLDELKAELEKLRAEKGTDAVLTIKADNATRLITIQGVKDVARQSGVLKVKYLAAENEVDKVLPPIPTEENSIKVMTNLETRVAKHNLLMVFMNARGDIMTTRPDGKEAIVGLDELKSIVKQFVDNTEWVNGELKQKNPNYSSFRWRNYKVGNGTFRHPESNGIVSVQTTLDVDAEKYLALHSTIIQAYAELREELAQRSFKQSFESLGEDDRRYIMQAIPIKVSEAEPKKIKQASNANIPRPKDFFKDADAGDIPL
ncbi:MAG: biopolymer transporter ExbD [Alistipes sp.]|nr:biopolymer transporter ExbD [Alistipes sp.]